MTNTLLGRDVSVFQHPLSLNDLFVVCRVIVENRAPQVQLVLKETASSAPW